MADKKPAKKPAKKPDAKKPPKKPAAKKPPKEPAARPGEATSAIVQGALAAITPEGITQVREGDYDLFKDDGQYQTVIGKLYAAKQNATVFVEHYGLDPNFFPIGPGQPVQSFVVKVHDPPEVKNYTDFYNYVVAKGWKYTACLAVNTNSSPPSP